MTEDRQARPGCLGGLVHWLTGLSGSAASGREELPYGVRDDFLSPGELSFFHTLNLAVGDRAVVCAKVNLADVLYVKSSRDNAHHRNRIAQKHLDFLLCDPSSMRPLVGVELDDASHDSRRARERDAFVDTVFQAARLPLVHIRSRSGFDPKGLAAQLEQYLAGAEGQVPLVAAIPQPGTGAGGAPPVCPKCNVPMVIRVATKGKRGGEQFYGCPNFPKCRQTFPFE